MKLRIGKKPRFFNEKYDGPDVYSIMGVLANEINEVPTTLDRIFEAEKSLVKVDFEKFKNRPLEEFKQFQIVCKFFSKT